MPFQLLSADAISTVTVGDQQVSRKGQKFSEIRFSGQQPCFQLCAEALYSPFKAGVYQGTGQETRVNLDLQISEELSKVLAQYDKFFRARDQETCAESKLPQTHTRAGRRLPRPAQAQGKFHRTYGSKALETRPDLAGRYTLSKYSRHARDCHCLLYEGLVYGKPGRSHGRTEARGHL